MLQQYTDALQAEVKERQQLIGLLHGLLGPQVMRALKGSAA